MREGKIAFGAGGASRFPSGYLAAALSVSAVALSLVFFQLRAQFLSTSESHSSHYEILLSANSLLTLDAKLTMSATLSVATGEGRYTAEYNRLASELDAVIKNINGMLRTPGGSPYTAAVNEANLRLMELEQKAVRLERAGKRQEASKVLISREYLDLKKAYARGVTGLLNQFESERVKEGEALRRKMIRGWAASAAASSLALLFWIVSAVAAASWARTKGAAESMVAQKEEEFRHFFDTVQEIFYRADWKGRLTDITPSIKRYSGYTREELIGVPISNLYLNPEDRKLLIKEMLSKGIVEDYEVKLKTKDRGVLDVLVNARLLKGFAGLPVGIEGSLRDITVRKAAEDKLARMNRMYTILSRVNEAIVRIRTRQKLFEEVCRIAVEAGGIKFAWVGIPGKDGFLRPVAYSGHGEAYLADIKISLDPALNKGKGPSAVAAREGRVVINSDTRTNPDVEAWREVMLRYGFGSSAAFPIAGTGMVALYAEKTGFFKEDEARLLASLAEDVTYAVNSIESELSKKETESQLEHTREQLRQSQKMEAVGRLAGGIAHDFNNMLTAILSYAGFLRDGLDQGDPRRGDVMEILSAAEKAATLTKQLLAFSRRQMLLPRIISLNDTARATEGMLRRLIGENVEVSMRLAAGVGNIKADPGQIEQVLINLAVNARDAISGHGRIIIETAMVSFSEDTPGRHDVIPTGRYVRLIVSDTGSGMSQETLSHIFEPFFTTKEQGKGTGLGLSTVYGIVKQSGGYIWVYSEPSGGTSFKIYFPEVKEGASAAPSVEAAPPPGGTENILLVEDDAPVRAAIVRILREAGYTVTEAANGVEALALGKEAIVRFSLLITDLMMPKMGGIELSAAVRQLAPGLPVLYISGYSEELVAVRENIGANSSFIQKPVSPETLLRKLRDALSPGEAKK